MTLNQVKWQNECKSKKEGCFSRGLGPKGVKI